MVDLTPAELLERAGSGDAEAWAAIVERHERLVWWVVRGFRFDDATSADIVQTVWLRLAEHCTRIRQPEHLAAWLATTCRNECLASGRRTAREVADVSLLDAGRDEGRAWEADVSEGVVDQETLSEVLQAFDRLPAECQQLLRLLCADPPLDYRTISALLDRPVGWIGPTRARCLGKLRRLMEVGHA